MPFLSLRRVTSHLPPLRSLQGAAARRCFHIQPKDVPSFLASTGIHGLDAAIRSDSSVVASDAQSALAVLLHADRTAQPWLRSNIGDSAERVTLYGPSILAAPMYSLPHRSDDQADVGQGGLRLLKLRSKGCKTIRQISLPSGVEDSFDRDEAKEFIKSLGVDKNGDKVVEILRGFWQIFDRHEGLWFTFRLMHNTGKIEIINPFLKFDPFSVPRQPLLQPYHATRPLDANTLSAERGGLFYIKLDLSLPRVGKVGCFGYGAGNTMATMDGPNFLGGGPANFLDGGGGANRQNARLAIETLNREEQVNVLFVNCFGGITKTDVVAQGIIDAVREYGITKPIVVRMKGTGSEEAAKVLRESGIDFAFHDNFTEAAAHAVQAARDGHL